MQWKDWIPVIGWPITFVLGIASASIVARLTRKRQLLIWALVSESELVPRELSKRLGLPVTIQVGNANPASLTIVVIRIGNGGNEVIQNVSIAAGFNDGAAILNIRPVSDLGEYQKQISWSIEQNRSKIAAAFINPGRTFELEFLLTNYEMGSADVDAAAPGLEVRRRDPATALEISSSLWRSISPIWPIVGGLRFNAREVSMSEIAEEIRALRRYLSAQSSSEKR